MIEWYNDTGLHFVKQAKGGKEWNDCLDDSF